MVAKSKRDWLQILIFVSCINPIYAESSIIIENLNERFGLERNQVNCVLQDSIGFLWFGMANGLYRYDNTTIKNTGTSNIISLDHLDIRSITEYKKGVLLLGTYDYGLVSYNTQLEKFDTLSFNTKIDFSNIKINCIAVEESGIIWVGTKSGLYKLKGSNNSANTFELLQHFIWQNTDLMTDEIIDIKISEQGDIWYLAMFSIGYINKQTNTIVSYPTLDANTSFVFLDDNRILISCYGSGLKIFNVDSFELDADWDFHDEEDIKARYVYKDSKGNIWMSISNVGLFLLDPTLKLNNATFISNSSNQYNTLNSNVILYIGESKDGTLFICSDAGINIIHQKDVYFNSVSSEFDKKSGFFYGIRAVSAINRNEVLIGTMGKGLKHFNLNNKKLSNIILDPANKDLGKNIQAILKDKKGNVWLGTEGDGVMKIIPDGNSLIKQHKFINYRAFNEPFPNKTMLNDFIMCLLEDTQENIWIGTWYGLSLLKQAERLKKDQSEAEIVNFLNDPKNNSSLSSNTVLCMLLDNTGKVWIGTQNGLNKVVTTDNAYYFENCIKDINGNSLNAKSILSIYQSKKGDIWFSTADGGICLFDPQKMLFYEFNENNGFINHVVNSIIEDENRNLWLGTGDGICRYDPETRAFNVYKREDGLVTNLFLLNAQSKLEDKLFFGGDKGFVYFTPENIKPVLYDKNLVFTDVKIFNNSLPVNLENGVLRKSICYTESIELKYNQNLITFEFSALNFNQQKDIQYSCILEGLENSWNNLGKEQKITYTNLKHGSYIFKVIAYDSGYRNNAEQIALNIRIHPPFWKRKIAYVLYIVIIIVGAYYIYSYFLNLEKKKSAIALERLNAKKEHEIDLMKLRFFMNVSHEFRTPLTLLSAPLEALMKGKADKAKTNSYYQVMHQNIQKLKRLIDELLELRKIDAGYLKMEWKIGDMVDFIKRIFDTFQTYAEKRNIRLIFETEIDELNMYFDADKLDKVIFNLLSNAFKYTENDGNISLSINIHKDTGQNLRDNNIDYVQIKIKDSGVGISKNSINTIFQRFHNSENIKPIDSASTGIGLSLAKELIDLHMGTIEVESEENIGSTFTICLPVYKKIPHANAESNQISENLSDNIELVENNNDPEEVHLEVSKGQKPIVLIVEDNPDLRNFLFNELKDNFDILQCANGKEGFNTAIQKIPDLIVSDIMMEKMDGVTMCKQLKSDEKTSHVPVILLTARHADNMKLDSYQIGADDYITKPFNIDILKTRINNLINQRRKLRAKFSLGIDNVHTIDPSNTLDSRFIEKLNKVINENIDSTELNPTFLASKMAMSRMQLYRKVTALTDNTVSNYIRTIRLNRSVQLLLTTDLQIAEIATKVGFTEPSNFTKSFSKHFNQTPSQFINTNKKKKEIKK